MQAAAHADSSPREAHVPEVRVHPRTPSSGRYATLVDQRSELQQFHTQAQAQRDGAMRATASGDSGMVTDTQEDLEVVAAQAMVSGQTQEMLTQLVPADTPKVWYVCACVAEQVIAKTVLLVQDECHVLAHLQCGPEKECLKH